MMDWKDWFLGKPCGLEPGSESGWDPFKTDVEQYGLETAVHHAPFGDRRWGAEFTHRANLLSILARDRDWRVRKRVAANRHASAETYVVLAQDESRVVRSSVAENPFAPVEAFRILAGDEGVIVRLTLAYNPSASAEVLTRLAWDENIDVRLAVVRHYNTPTETRRALEYDESGLVQVTASFVNALRNIK